jgi:hypothetical protein
MHADSDSNESALNTDYELRQSAANKAWSILQNAFAICNNILCDRG